MHFLTILNGLLMFTPCIEVTLIVDSFTVKANMSSSVYEVMISNITFKNRDHISHVLYLLIVFPKPSFLSS